jgi:hypothetical protein
MTPTLRKKSKDALLDSIETSVGLELDRIAFGLRARLRDLSHFHLRALERAFLLAYQEGYDAPHV